jgi:hypothetical protein
MLANLQRAALFKINLLSAIFITLVGFNGTLNPFQSSPAWHYVTECEQQGILYVSYGLTSIGLGRYWVVMQMAAARVANVLYGPVYGSTGTY